MSSRAWGSGLSHCLLGSHVCSKRGAMSKDILLVDDFLPPQAYQDLAQFVASEPMAYGSRSNFKTDPHGHWSRAIVAAGPHNLADVSNALEQREKATSINVAWKFLRDTHLMNSVLIRCYVNGYTYGTDGYFHADSERSDEHTTIIYANDYWEPDWAGETVFLGKDGDIAKSVLPKRNRAIIFPADIQHAGRAVSRKCMVLRKAVIFKTRKKRSSNFEKLSAFLREAGAVNRSHKLGTLHDHLVRTFSLLEMKGFASSICFGGGLHAIYGTNVFDRGILTQMAKLKIVSEFGERAEELVHLFSLLDRPTTLESPLQLNSETAVVKLTNGGALNLDREIFDDLRKIESANLADQRSLARYRALSVMWNAS
jgi:hypothetical protein